MLLVMFELAISLLHLLLVIKFAFCLGCTEELSQVRI